MFIVTIVTIVIVGITIVIVFVIQFMSLPQTTVTCLLRWGGGSNKDFSSSVIVIAFWKKNQIFIFSLRPLVL